MYQLSYGFPEISFSSRFAIFYVSARFAQPPTDPIPSPGDDDSPLPFDG